MGQGKDSGARYHGADGPLVLTIVARVGLSSAHRQRAFLERRRAEGLVSVTVLVPAPAAADLRIVAEALRARRDLVVGILQSVKDGRLYSARKIMARTRTPGGKT